MNEWLLLMVVFGVGYFFGALMHYSPGEIYEIHHWHTIDQRLMPQSPVISTQDRSHEC